MPTRHLIGVNDTATSIALRYNTSLSALRRLNGRDLVDNLQFSRQFLDCQYIRVLACCLGGLGPTLRVAGAITAAGEQSAPPVSARVDPSQLLEVHVDKALRTAANRLFLEEDLVRELLNENGWDIDWAVWSYSSDLQAARGRPLHDPSLELIDRVVLNGPPTKDQWEQDSASLCCSLCQRRFAKFWEICTTAPRRKHHCRACAKVFCGPCSEYYAELPLVGPMATRTPQRVCKSCNRIDWNYMTKRYKVDDELLKHHGDPPSHPRPAPATEQEYRQRALCSSPDSKQLLAQEPPEYSELDTQPSVVDCSSSQLGELEPLEYAASAPPAYEAPLIP